MKISTFHGINPRTPENRLPLGVGTRAHNIDLSRGTLAPWREPRRVHEFGDSLLTLEVYGCHYFGWKKCVDVARYLPDLPRLYITGRRDYPEVATIDHAKGTLKYRRLGVPAPDTIPLLSYSRPAKQSIATENRVYVFTYVNELGEESAPSFPSTNCVIDDGGAVKVSGWKKQPAAYGVVAVRVYRAATPFASGSEKEQGFATDYLFVEQVPVGTASFTDNLKAVSLGPVLATKEVREPPEGLTGMTAIDGEVTLAGYVNNRLYFSKRFEPWNWPVELELTLDENIVGLESLDGKLYVTTTGYPYVVDATAQGDRPEAVTDRKDYPFGDIACGYSSSRVMTPYGLVYVTKEGLALLTESAKPTLVTDAYFSAREWERLRPETARLAYWRGMLVCVTDTTSFMLLLDRTTYKTLGQLVELTTISDAPVDMKLSDSGELLMLSADGVVTQWNAGSRLRPYEWVSPIYTYFQHWLPVASIEVDGAVTFTVESEAGVQYTRDVVTNAPFRMRRLGRNRKQYIRLKGTGEVSLVSLGATEIDESNGR